ncbi:MAG: hypothetical protein JXB47_09890 [Anaerolineae bacterium]|nr:hypothetical protein [Anaerolineae bacterium]
MALHREEMPIQPGIWRAGPVMTLALAGLALAGLLVTGLVGLQLDGLVLNLADLALVVVPLGLWWLAYYRPAQRTGKAVRYMPVLILASAVITNGLALPIIERIYRVDAWLVNAPGNTRIAGYTLIVGFLEAYLKFALIRYTVFPHAMRERGDAVAYGVAVSLGFAAVQSLRFFLDGGAAPLGPAVLRVAETYLSQIAFGAVLGYFFASARFARRAVPVWWFALALAVTALLNGLYTVFRAGIIVSGFGISGTANSPILGLAVATVLALGVFFVLTFLNGQAEARDAATPGMVIYR